MRSLRRSSARRGFGNTCRSISQPCLLAMDTCGVRGHILGRWGDTRRDAKSIHMSPPDYATKRAGRRVYCFGQDAVGAVRKASWFSVRRTGAHIIVAAKHPCTECGPAPTPRSVAMDLGAVPSPMKRLPPDIAGFGRIGGGPSPNPVESRYIRCHRYHLF